VQLEKEKKTNMKSALCFIWLLLNLNIPGYFLGLGFFSCKKLRIVTQGSKTCRLSFSAYFYWIIFYTAFASKYFYSIKISWF